MANLKEIRGRITSISSTMQITSAMKMVSAAKLKKATDAIVMLRPYSEKLQEIIENVSSTVDLEGVSTYTEEREVKKVLYIVVTSNKGLAGAFNSSVIKELNNSIADSQHEIEILTVGKKVYDAVRRSKKVYDNQSAIFDGISFEVVSNFVENVMRDYREGSFDKVYVIYNKFINAATQEVKKEQILPIALPEKAEAPNTDYLFEPNAKEILDVLMPKSIKTQVYKAILDSVASEHGARMTAMHKATDNAEALRNDLKIFYNKARQAAITNEILEIVGGAEALKNS
ncbi:MULTISPECIES: ATP synthase F1 subunit gamma [unclassified Kaistella]|uniref:ATP synthase F1 subunit gamma n=1 Tax=unclassified Kaistella TaxID=2762626 RepID=UPI0027343EB9|nr:MULTISPECIES: ATP synthase F1 subunit gamma [unclassified Kaistella]MCZ2084322.1 ATP synthase F1 subunit gamma [Flavobacteriales bacterium]MDP2454794.1 ATP synthase F1 subunit gamma [Kaistella sp. SH11-4b]MDP2457531.1 ATP synthase F1 subunit gamma [Kaistella sp. SH40-3]MDP2460291.1 ATP synthase F1 subunit gamma [Kaistella sp. SH19-2b]